MFQGKFDALAHLCRQLVISQIGNPFNNNYKEIVTALKQVDVNQRNKRLRQALIVYISGDDDNNPAMTAQFFSFLDSLLKKSSTFSEKYKDPTVFIDRIKSDASKDWVVATQDFYDVVSELNYFPIIVSPQALWFQPDSEEKYPSSKEQHLKNWSAHYLRLAGYSENSNIIVSAGPIKPPISSHVFHKVGGTPFYSINDAQHEGTFLRMLSKENVSLVISLGIYGDTHGKDFPDYRSFDGDNIRTTKGESVELKDDYQNGSFSNVSMSQENEACKATNFDVINFKIKDNTPLYFSFEQMCFLMAHIQDAQMKGSSILAHCASGVGRTGVFSYFVSLVFDEKLCDLVEEVIDDSSNASFDEKISALIDVLQTDLNNIRARRHSLQTPEQLASAVINAILFYFLNKQLKAFYQTTERFADFSWVLKENQSSDDGIEDMYGKLRECLVAAVSNLDFYYAFTTRSKGIVDLFKNLSLAYEVLAEQDDLPLCLLMHEHFSFLQKVALFSTSKDFLSEENFFSEFKKSLDKLIDRYCMSYLLKDRPTLSKLRQFFLNILTEELGVALKLDLILLGKINSVVRVIDNQIKYLQYEEQFSKLILAFVSPTVSSGPKKELTSMGKGFQKFRTVIAEPTEIGKKSFDANVFLLTYIYLILDAFKNNAFKSAFSIVNELLSKNYDVKAKDLASLSKALESLVPSQAATLKGLVSQLFVEMTRGFSTKIVEKNVPTQSINNNSKMLAKDVLTPSTNANNQMFFRSEKDKIEKYREYVLDFIYSLARVIVDGAMTNNLDLINESFDQVQKESNFYQSMMLTEQFFNNIRSFCVQEFSGSDFKLTKK